jgi:hypothetical protein
MTAKAGLISVVTAVLLMAFPDGNLSAGSAHAEEICLAAPNAPAPQGSHWYYRTDFIKQSKCWYSRAEGQAIETPIAQQKPESIAAKRPAAAMPKTASDQRAPVAKQLHPHTKRSPRRPQMQGMTPEWLDRSPSQPKWRFLSARCLLACFGPS